MATFSYKAKTTTGQTVSGKFDAQDKTMVVSLLRGKGLFPIDIKEETLANKEIKLFSSRKVTQKDLAIFCRQFYTMLNAGVAVIACLDMLKKQTENPSLVAVITKCFEDVQKGKALSESMSANSKVFPTIMTSMVEVGEVGGTLDAVMERLAVHFEKENKLKQKVKSAMMYPAVIGCVALVMVIFMLTFIVPRFVSMFKTFGSELPKPTKVLLAVSNAITDIRVLVLLAVIIALVVYIFKKIKNSEKGKYVLDMIVLRIPGVGKNVKKILASRFTRTLSSLLETGVPLIQALDVVDKVVDNQLVTKGLVKVKEDIKRGSNLAGPLETIGIFPVMVTQMISIGEEAGSLDSIMVKVADFYDDEVETSITQLIAMLEPILIFLLAAIVGSIVVAMILPVFSMYGNIGK